MNFSYDFHPIAEEELFEAIEFLDRQREGYGGLLAEAIVETIDLILARPQSFPKTIPEKNLRKAALIPPFHKTFSIFYDFNGENILIVSVFNNRRDPQNWKNRSG